MDHGKLLAEGTLEELKKLVGEDEVVAVRGRFTAEEARTRWSRLDNVRVLSAKDGQVSLAVPAGGRRGVELLSQILDGELEVEGVSIEPPSLNGLFLELTGRELRD